MKHCILAATALLNLGLPDLGRADAKPNIVIVVADDMGWRDTGYRGNPNNTAPANVPQPVAFSTNWRMKPRSSLGRKVSWIAASGRTQCRPETI